MFIWFMAMRYNLLQDFIVFHDMCMLMCNCDSVGYHMTSRLGAAAWRLSLLYLIMKEFASKFYGTRAWRNTRRAYSKSVGGLCEMCLRQGVYTPGEIVHHIKHLTPQNIDDPAVTLDWNNLMLVCRDCHAKIHENNKRGMRYTIGQDGSIAVSPLCDTK